ncbi:MAG: CPBP family intramembrane metalloprotease [Sedimentisphaerales bacterium]|nr:CPBP family intramembrane metalloprotease [Sedimentisphaerales bacterium]
MFKEIIQELAGQVTIVDLIVCPAGITVLAIWLIRTSFGVQSLANAPSRRNNMPIHLALIPFIIWIAAFWALDSAKKTVFPDLSGWQDTLTENLIMILAAAPPITTILVIGRLHFARGLKGFGLNPKTIGGDLLAALLNLLAILPVLFAALFLTTIAGKLIIGPDFHIQQHEGLRQITAYPQLSVRVLILIATILIVPVTEEMVFRGIFQTLLRSYITRPWPAIVLTSLVFIIFHENPQHWPALFMLSLCLGYSYEKTGSLFRPVLLHSMFNALSVFVALGQ